MRRSCMFRINEYNIKQKPPKSRGGGQLSWCHIPFIRWYNCFNYMFNIFDAKLQLPMRCESINFFSKYKLANLCSSNASVSLMGEPKVNTSRWFLHSTVKTIIHKHIRAPAVQGILCPSSFGTN